MVTEFFLGANTKDGFFSLYSGFPGENAFLHIIKGSPGNGKSGFMRAIGKEAEKQGLDVCYVLCSGDIASLDGVFIPALSQAWVDGTSPHCIDSGVFGVDSDYVNLSQYCRHLEGNDCSKASALTRAYRAEYREAYKYLNVYRTLSSEYNIKVGIYREIFEKVYAICRECFTGSFHTQGKTNKRFLSCISGNGRVILASELSVLCKLIFHLNCNFAEAYESMHHIVRQASEIGEDIVIYYHPVDPTLIEAVMIPRLSIAFTAGDIRCEEEFQIEAECGNTENSGDNEYYLLDKACEHLKKAKLLHDELESVYAPHIDFAGIDKHLANTIKETFAV